MSLPTLAAVENGKDASIDWAIASWTKRNVAADFDTSDLIGNGSHADFFWRS